MRKPKKTNIEGKINFGLGGVSVSQEFAPEEFCITAPEFEETNKTKILIHGTGLQKNWRVILINEISENRCYLQSGIGKPTSKGEWKVFTKFNESSSGAERTIYAFAIKEEDIEIVRQLLDEKNIIKTIPDVEEILVNNKIKYQISSRKRLVYIKDEMPDEVLRIIPTEILRKVTLAYQKVLEREPDDGGLKDKAKKVYLGKISVKDLIKELGLSDEYERRFIKFKEPIEIVERMYLHFLGRKPENNTVVEEKVRELSQIGWQELVKVFIESDEYVKNFGDDKVVKERA